MIINGQSVTKQELDVWCDVTNYDGTLLKESKTNFIIELGLKIGRILSIARIIFPNGK